MVLLKLIDELLNLLILLLNFRFMLLNKVAKNLFMLFLLCWKQLLVSLLSFLLAKLLHLTQFDIHLCLPRNICIQSMDDFSLLVNDSMRVLKHWLQLLIPFLQVLLQLILQVLRLDFWVFFQGVNLPHVGNGCVGLLLSDVSVLKVQPFTVLLKLCYLLLKCLDLSL